MEQIEFILGSLADFLWGNWLLFALMGLGLVYSIITNWIQIQKFPMIFRMFLSAFKDKKGDKDSKNASPLQALLTALGSCVGSGNIVGVSTAMIAGGPGALFWMWVAAILGMATKFGEITLGLCYREKKTDGEYIGGPMYYIASALKSPWLGSLVAVLLFVQNAGGTLIQSNTISNVVTTAFNISPLVTGICVAGLMIYILRGGFKRLVHVAEKAVPFMALLYVFGGIVVVLCNITSLPAVIENIFTSAFNIKAGIGGVAGISMRNAMRYGVARGLYSNEAGEGSAAVIHSTANTDQPVRQGLFGVMEVFIDTIIICSTTGFAILSSGVQLQGANAATLSASAFATVFSPLKYVVYISLILFATTSLMSQWYFGHVSLLYLKSKNGDLIYKMIFPVLIIIGSCVTVEMVWSLQDCALGLLIIPNIIALLVLAPKVRKMTKEYFNNTIDS